MPIYTRHGDDGTTGLLFGGRVRKDSAAIAAVGAVDEAQAALGVARAVAGTGSELDELLVGLERDLWVLMAELSAGATRRDRLVGGKTMVTPEMVDALEPVIDDLTGRAEPPTEFVVPGQTLLSALLDLARTQVRRAEREVVAALAEERLAPGEPEADGSGHAVRYLNRLSDLVWTMARWQEGTALPARTTERRP